MLQEADAPVKTPRGTKRGAPSTAEGALLLLAVMQASFVSS